MALMTLLCCALTANVAMGARKMTEKKAQKWVNKKEWANGFKAVPYAGTDMVEFATQYAKDPQMWNGVFKFFATHDLAKMDPGKYPIDGDRCFINVQDAQTKPASQCKIEGHTRYIDLQYVVVGTERFGMVASEDATVSEPLRGDNTFYTAPADKMKYADSNPGIFFLFFPKNYHQALVQPDVPGNVRKVVAKIEYARD